jgi:RHS repeat-associated protein
MGQTVKMQKSNGRFLVRLAAGLAVVIAGSQLWADTVITNQTFTATPAQKPEIDTAVRATNVPSCLNPQRKKDKKKITCSPCDPCPPEAPYTADANSHPTPNASGSGASYIDYSRLSYVHYAPDYIEPKTSAGCNTCGGSSDGSGSLPTFELTRMHRYRDITYFGMFGPGVFSNYDISLILSKSVTATDGSGSMRLYDPNDRTDRPLSWSATNQRYTDARNNALRSIVLIDAQGQVTVNHTLAKTAVLTRHDGWTMTFDIIRTNNDPNTLSRFGRLRGYSDRHGNALQIAYTYAADASDTELNSDRSQLWKIATVTDAHQRVAQFAYADAPVSGRWVVSQITQPTGAVVQYHYNLTPQTNDTNPIVGLSGVTHADGTQSQWTVTYDTTTACQVLTFNDPAAGGTHRNKSIYLTVDGWMQPVDGSFRNQPGRLFRMSVNGEGELCNVSLPTNLSNGDQSMQVLDGAGRMQRAVFRGEQDISSGVANTWEINVNSTTGEVAYEGDFTNQETYNVDGQYKWTTKKWDAHGQATTYTRERTAGRLTKVTNPNGTTVQTTYNSNGKPLTVTDESGRQTVYTYNDSDDLLTRTVAYGTSVAATTTYTYNSRGQVLTQTDPNGNTTTCGYNTQGYLVTITQPKDKPTDPAAPVTTYAYDAAGRLTSSTDPMGRITSYDYDLRNRQIRTHYPDDSYEETVYGTGVQADLVVTRRDRNGNLTSYSYDAHGRQIAATSAAGTAVALTTTTTYLPGTTRTLSTTTAGKTTTYEYDSRQRIVATHSQPNTGTTLTARTVYDKDDRELYTQDAYGRRTFSVYDNMDRVIRTVQETVPNALTLPTDLEAYNAYLAGLTRQSGMNSSYLITQTEYNPAGEVVRTLDALAVPTRYVYDAQGRRSQTYLADGTSAAAQSETRYDAAGNVSEVRYPRYFSEGVNARTVYTYTGRNLVASQTGASGTTSYTYYLDGQRFETFDARNFRWYNLYGCCGRLLASVDPTGAATVNNYDHNGNVVASAQVADIAQVTNYLNLGTDPTQVLSFSTIRYDARNRPVARSQWLTLPGLIDPQNPPIASALSGLTSTVAYDEQVGDGQGLETAYSSYLTGLGLDATVSGSLVTSTSPAGDTSVSIRDAAGRSVVAIDPLGHATRMQYDVLATPTVANFTMPGALLVTTVTDANNHSASSYSDAVGRTLITLDANNAAQLAWYDDRGQLRKQRDANNTGMDATYDAQGRRLTVTDTLNHTVTTAYNTAGNVTSTTDPKNQTSSATYDADSRLLTTTDRLGNVTTRTYDTAGNLLTIKDAENQTTTYTYDSRGYKTLTQYPQEPNKPADQVQLTYNAAGRLVTRITADNITTTYDYDLAGRLTSRTAPDEQVDSYAYDVPNREVTAHSQRYGHVVVARQDANGRPASETLKLAATGPNFTVNYDYDAVGNLTTLTYPDGQQITRSYTNRNQLAALGLANQTPSQSRTYDVAGRLDTRTYANNLTNTSTYNTDNSLATLTTPAVATLTYGYDANGNRTGETYSNVPPAVLNKASRSLDYDAQDRLTKQELADGNKQTWTLSAVGNWTQTQLNQDPAQTRTHTATHQIASMDSTALSYEAKGNMTTDQRGYVYRWDHENRLIEVLGPPVMESATTQPEPGSTPGSTTQPEDPYADPDGVSTPTSQPTTQPTIAWRQTYTYDAMGRRVSRTTYQNEVASTTVYVSAGMQEVAEYTDGTDAAAPSRTYVYGSYVDEPMQVRVFASATTQPASTQNATTQPSYTDYYYHTNALYSVIAVTDTAGTVVERYTYDAYGQRTITDADGTPRTESVLGNEIGFTGRRLDPLTNQYYFRARYYDAAQGRFISRDPLEYVDGMSLYGGYYVPNGLDPEGKKWWEGYFDAIGYAFGGGPEGLTGAMKVWGGATTGRLEAYGTLANTVSFGATDSVQITNTASYTSPGLEVSRVSFTIAREAGIAAITLGAGNAALNGSRLAHTSYTALNTIQLGRSGYEVYQGGTRVYDGDNWGYLQMGLGGLGATGSAGMLFTPLKSQRVLLQGDIFRISRKCPIVDKTDLINAQAIINNNPALNGVGASGGGMIVRTGGRLGSQATRAHIADVAAELKSRSWRITGGGGEFAEEYLCGAGGGRLGSNWVDITAMKNGQTLRINTIDTLADGLTPTAREAAAAAAIRAKTGGHLLLIPKP